MPSGVKMAIIAPHGHINQLKKKCVHTPFDAQKNGPKSSDHSHERLPTDSR